MAEKKRLVYWGIGNIGKLCLKQYPNIQPDFLIDSNWNSNTFRDFPVKKPDEVDNWDELFIVITTMAFSEVYKILNNKNLKKNKDYINYKDFFATEKKTVEEITSALQEYMDENKEYRNAILIFAPVFISRMTNEMIHFFQEYGIKRRPQKCILFSYLGITKKEYAEKKMDYPVFYIPEFSSWTGEANSNYEIEDNQLTHGELLQIDEKQWISELEKIKTHENAKLSSKVTAEIYWFYKNIFSIIMPSKIIIWGNWGRESYILAELAKRNHISYGFMEYGWIPGTFQFARRGLAGQSEYAVEPDKLLHLDIKSKNTEIKKIKNYILTHKIDTGNFRINEDDEKKLKQVVRERKTVFFVGMDDYGMGINPQSDYWNRYVSSVVSSTSEAVFFIAKICKKNSWNFVFKPHPNSADRNELDKNIIADNIIQVKYMEIDRLIQLSDVVVSIVSTVDYKTLIYGKPLIQLGHTTLFRKSCSYEVESINEIEYQLKEALEKGMTQEQNMNFELHMAQLLENYLWDDLSDRDLRYGLTLDRDFFDEEE